MTIDIEKYRHHMTRFELSEAEKTELLRTLWQVMEGFADRAFGLDPVSLSKERETPGKFAGDDSKLLELKANPLRNAFEKKS